MVSAVLVPFAFGSNTFTNTFKGHIVIFFMKDMESLVKHRNCMLRISFLSMNSIIVPLGWLIWGSHPGSNIRYLAAAPDLGIAHYILHPLGGLYELCKNVFRSVNKNFQLLIKANHVPDVCTMRLTFLKLLREIICVCLWN